MTHDGEFQEKLRQISQFVMCLDQLPDNECRVVAKELVQLLMDLHGAGLERMLEIIFESSEEGQRIIDKLGQDSLTGSLLLLYSLHPEDVETRVRAAVERLRPRLRKLGCAVESVEVDDSAVLISVTTAGHGCGSSGGEVRSTIEAMVYEAAPDVTSLEIRGLEQAAASGFVSLEKLAGKRPAAHDDGLKSESTVAVAAGEGAGDRA